MAKYQHTGKEFQRILIRNLILCDDFVVFSFLVEEESGCFRISIMETIIIGRRCTLGKLGQMAEAVYTSLINFVIVSEMTLIM